MVSGAWSQSAMDLQSTVKEQDFQIVLQQHKNLSEPHGAKPTLWQLKPLSQATAKCLSNSKVNTCY